MSKRLIAADRLHLNRPFTIFVEPGDLDENGNVEWFAKIAGYELDNMVYGPSPQRAIDEALDLLNALTGKCTTMKPEHNFIVKREGGWECARCNMFVHDEQLEDVDG